MTRRILGATSLVVVVTLVVGIITALVLQSSVAGSAANELGRQASATARLLEEDLAELEFRPGRGTAGEQLARVRSTLGRSLERAEVVGGHDAVEADLVVGQRSISIPPDQVALPSVPDATPEGEVTRVEAEGGTVLVAVERLDIGFAELVVGVARTQPLFPTRQLVWALLFALAVGAAMTLGLGVWFSRSLSARLRGIADAAREVGSGDLDARAPAEGDDEIGQVASTFNTMAADIAETRARERRFLMAVGHDLRTPLTTIRGYAEALNNGDVESEDLPGVAAALDRQTDQLSRLVGDIALLARLEADEFIIHAEPCDVAAVVGEEVGGYARRFITESIELSTDLAEDAVSVIDADRLRQIIGNLLDNALRYTPSDGAVVVAVSTGSDVVELRVANTGPRLGDDDIERVFDRLYVADHFRAERPAGSGLGLAIVRELVVAMGGTVTCSRGAESGMVFVVAFEQHAASPQ